MNTTLGPSVPFVNMEIGATDRGDFDFYKNLVATVSRNFDLADLRARSGFRLYYCEHCAGHESFLISAEIGAQTAYFTLPSLRWSASTPFRTRNFVVFRLAARDA